MINKDVREIERRKRGKIALSRRRVRVRSPLALPIINDLDKLSFSWGHFGDTFSPTSSLVSISLTNLPFSESLAFLHALVE